MPAPTRKPTVSRPVVNTAIAGTVLLGAGAFTLSFAALTDLARMAGIPHILAWIWPIIVDGLIVVSTVAIVALASHGRRALAYPWSLLIFGALVSIAANALHAILAADGTVPPVVSALVASMPPIVLLAVTHLSVQLVQRSAGSTVKVKAKGSNRREARQGDVQEGPLRTPSRSPKSTQQTVTPATTPLPVAPVPAVKHDLEQQPNHDRVQVPA